jgi:hypothetical protein
MVAYADGHPMKKKRRLGERRREMPRFKEGKRDRGLVIERHEYRPTARAFEYANTAL